MTENKDEKLYGSRNPILVEGESPTSTPERPNVLIILADDLASWMVGCYGNKEIRTPNIDNLARTGMRSNPRESVMA